MTVLHLYPQTITFELEKIYKKEDKDFKKFIHNIVYNNLKDLKDVIKSNMTVNTTIIHIYTKNPEEMLPIFDILEEFMSLETLEILCSCKSPCVNYIFNKGEPGYEEIHKTKLLTRKRLIIQPAEYYDYDLTSQHNTYGINLYKHQGTEDILQFTFDLILEGALLKNCGYLKIYISPIYDSLSLRINLAKILVEQYAFIRFSFEDHKPTDILNLGVDFI